MPNIDLQIPVRVEPFRSPKEDAFKSGDCDVGEDQWREDGKRLIVARVHAGDRKSDTAAENERKNRPL